MINAAISDVPADMTTAMHLCRGNFQSTFVASGGYEPVAEILFNEIGIDAYFMEYDSERAGGFEPLRFVPKGKTVVLGLVTSKSGKLESKDELKRRIDEAAKFVPLDQLCLSPQCGFASTEEGNILGEDEQWAKLARDRRSGAGGVGIDCCQCVSIVMRRADVAGIPLDGRHCASRDRRWPATSPAMTTVTAGRRKQKCNEPSRRFAPTMSAACCDRLR